MESVWVTVGGDGDPDIVNGSDFSTWGYLYLMYAHDDSSLPVHSWSTPPEYTPVSGGLANNILVNGISGSRITSSFALQKPLVFGAARGDNRRSGTYSEEDFNAYMAPLVSKNITWVVNYEIREKLSVNSEVTPTRAVREISTGEIKGSNNALVEIIPAPGEGYYIDVERLWILTSGDGDPDTVNGSDFSTWGYLLLMYVNDDSNLPVHSWSTPPEYTWVSGGLANNILVNGESGSRTYGTHALNTALVFGAMRGDNRRSGTYSEANFDAYMAPLVSKSVAWVVEYGTHQFLPEDREETPTRAVREISTEEIKNSNNALVEIIPAPGEGRYIDVESVWLIVEGDGDPDIANGSDFSTWGYLLLMYVNDDSNLPVHSWSTPPEYVTVSGGLANNILVNGTSGSRSVGNLSINKPLVFGAMRGDNRRSGTYSEANFDAYMAPLLDKSVTWIVNYSVKS